MQRVFSFPLFFYGHPIFFSLFYSYPVIGMEGWIHLFFVHIYKVTYIHTGLEGSGNDLYLLFFVINFGI